MITLAIGLLIPLLGTMLGSAFVFFMRDAMSARLQKVVARLRVGRDGGCFGVVMG